MPRERVHRLAATTTHRIFNRNQSIVYSPLSNLNKYTLNRAKVFVFDTGTKVRNGRDVAKAPGRSLVTNTQRLFQMKTAAHEFAVNGFDCAWCQRPLVQAKNLVQNGSFTVRSVNRSPGSAFELTNLNNQIGAFVEYRNQPAIDLVDGVSKFVKRLRIRG